MGTSLSGLTPATTFDGLLKTSDNEPLDGTLRTISDGSGVDSALQLSNSALKITGSLNVDDGNGNTLGNAITIGNDKVRLGHNYNNAMLSSPSGKVLLFAPGGIGVGNGYTNADSVTASLGIKGSGATSATTSLLVQNSAGTDMLKVRDDSSLLMYRASNGVELLKIGESGGNAILYANGNSNRSLVLGYQNTLTAFNQTEFKTYNGTGYSEAMVITGNSNTSQFVGIGETTPTARLHVKGSGNGSGTTSLLVQDSDGDDLLKVADNGDIILDNFRFGVASSYTYSNQKMIVGSTGGPDSGVKFQIKGSGATSATTALLVQNSAGSELFKLTDDGTINLGVPGDNPTIQSGSNAGKSLTLGSTATLSALNINLSTYDGINYSPVLSVTGNTDQFVGIGESTPTARLQVKGSGNTNTTTSLLVQNSDTSTSLTYDDSGELFLTGSKTQITLQRDGGNGGVIGNNNGRTYFGNSSALVYLGGKIGINQQTPTAQLQVKGSGATSATTALLVQNSAGTETFKVEDDGKVSLGGLSFSGTIITGNAYFSNIVYGANYYRQSNGSTTIGGGNAADSSSVLDVRSTTKGFLPPRMTTTERDAISSPASGLMVYNTTTNKAQCYNGTAWQDLF